MPRSSRVRWVFLTRWRGSDFSLREVTDLTSSLLHDFTIFFQLSHAVWASIQVTPQYAGASWSTEIPWKIFFLRKVPLFLFFLHIFYFPTLIVSLHSAKVISDEMSVPQDEEAVIFFPSGKWLTELVLSCIILPFSFNFLDSERDFFPQESAFISLFPAHF